MRDLHALAACIADQWSPAIGDPTAVGWIVAAAYMAAAVAAVAASWLGKGSGRERAFWAILAILMAALGVNKQLDLQSALTAAGRCLAQAQGWYAQRRSVQLHFIEAVAVAATASCLVALIVMRRSVRRLWPAILGIALVLAYVAIRAAGFHHVDRLISTRVIGGINANPLFELAGIVLILGNAAALVAGGRRRLRRAQEHRPARARR